jgi:hypothetical protein
MDESERLIARAALGSPSDALKAWEQWRATYDPATASSLLVWAGGYVHRNIVAGGGRDEYLAGLARYNWVANQRQLVAAHDDLVELASHHALVALKSFDASRTDDALSLRPVADIDLYVDARRLRRVVSWLRSRGYVPLLNASDTEFFERIVPQRGSWNFTRAATATGVECSIDLHWKFFDGLSLAQNRRFARRWTRPTDASFGSVRALMPEARFALMAVQRRAQDDGKDTVLFDAGHILGDLAPRRLVAVTRASRSHASVLSLLDAIAEFTDAREVDELRAVVEAGFHITNRQRAVRTLRVARKMTTGSPAAVATLSENEATKETIVCLTDDLPAGTGWFHLLPGDSWRWSTVPEARLRFAVPELPNAGRRRARTVPRTVQITVELNPKAWAACSAPFVDVICNGRAIGRIEKASETATFDVPIPARTRILDLRFRGTAANLPAADPRSLVFNRIVAPVERIRLSPSNGSS